MALSLFSLISIAVCFGMVCLVTWLFIRRLKAKTNPIRSFLKWIVDLFDCLLGL